MSDKLDKLNRLRVNAGKGELKSWKASQSKLNEAIAGFEAQGFTDTVPGANVQATPKTEDPEVAKALPEEEPPAEKTVTKVKPACARGADNGAFTEHSRKAVQDHRIKERRDQKAEKVRLSEEDKGQIKREAELRKGEVDPKKDPEKAARQKKHIEEKQKARAAAGNLGNKKEVGKDEVTVADIARDLDRDPKICRAKLRRHEEKLREKYPMTGDRWVFPKAARKDIEKILG